MRVKYDLKDFNKKMNSAIAYGTGYINETKKSESKLARKLGNASLEAFYDFLDAMASMHPDLLHHVYEWDQTGSPGGRLYKVSVSGTGQTTVTINAEFLQSQTARDSYSVPFYNKAEVMELGIPVTIEAINSQALFFVDDGQEFFRMGPIIIPNPGGSGVRGSFVKFFEKFYNEYFDEMFLESIGFYRHMSRSDEFLAGWTNGVNGGGASAGSAAARRWISSAPGGDNAGL
jgi:hypothetical protein